MTLQELMKTKPETLARKQLDALKEHCINVLQNIKDLIDSERFNEVKNFTFYSPAGDCMGSENNCINFSFEKGVMLDVQEICEKMKQIKQLTIKK